MTSVTKCPISGPDRLRFRALLLAALTLLFGLAHTARADAAKPAAGSEITIGYVGGMGLIYYPAGERDPKVVQAVESGIAAFQKENPDALLVDVGGFLGPASAPESAYTLPPLPAYGAAGVDAVNLDAGGLGLLVALEKHAALPTDKGLPPLVTSLKVTQHAAPSDLVRSAAQATLGADRKAVIVGTSSVRTRGIVPDSEALLVSPASQAQAVREAIESARAAAPGALAVVLADLPPEEARALAKDVPSIDVLLTNAAALDPKPEKIGEATWLVGRYPSGVLGELKLTPRADGRIGAAAVRARDLVADRGPLSLDRVLSQPPAKPPRVGIRLSDPVRVIGEMGFEGITVREIASRNVAEPIAKRLAVPNVHAYQVNQGPELVGRLYRVDQTLSTGNGRVWLNVLLDASGSIKRLTAKDPMFFLGGRMVNITTVLQPFEGHSTKSLPRLPEHLTQGIEPYALHLADTLRFVGEVDAACFGAATSAAAGDADGAATPSTRKE